MEFRHARRIGGAGLLVFAASLANPREVLAGKEGEARSVLRDADRVYTTVAGDADASAVVQNPGNLGFLKGFDAVVDVAATAANRGRRGSGAGVFLAVPLPWQILAVGVGMQALWREQSSAPTLDINNPDAAFGKFSLSFALPLMRWIPGLSIGVQYGRLFSRSNFLAAGTNQVDLGIGWRANRFLALGLALRGINDPVVGVEGNHTRLPMEVDPELALRPLGSPVLELAAGARIATISQPLAPIHPFTVQPRGRLLVGAKGVRGYVEAERIAFFDPIAVAGAVDAVRVSAGLQITAGHVGIAGGPIAGLSSQAGADLDGGAGRLHLSRAHSREGLPVAPRRVTRLPLAGYGGDRGTARLVAAIDELGARRAEVLLIDLDNVGHNLPQLEEIREALLRFRARSGQVVAYLRGGGTRAYFLASAADRIIAHPEESLAITGISVRTLYYGDLLARLGAQAEFVRIAEYKGSPEVWSRSTASEPVARQREQLMGDVWNHLIRLIARERGGQDPQAVAAFVDEAPYSPKRAQERGWVDELAWPDQIDASLERWLGKKVRIEAPAKVPKRELAWGKPPHVAVLYIDGDLVEGTSAQIPLLGMELAGSETLVAEIDKLREDPTVRALVVRIDSRGGSVSAASAIARALDRVAARKPVVISLGGVAASGGYYIATSGRHIFADATTTTGSIGIFYPKVDLSGFLEKFGVGVDVVGMGQHATLRSWWKPYSDSEREAAMRDIQAGYDVFVERVAKARSMTVAQVDGVARGRVFSGVRAIEVGLVDDYGGLREAVLRARAFAGLRPGDDAVVYYPAPPGLLEQVRRLFGLDLELPLSRDGTRTVRALGIASPLLRLLRSLPAAIWIGDGPEPLALGLEEHILE